jgi:hypothetical protein
VSACERKEAKQKVGRGGFSEESLRVDKDGREGCEGPVFHVISSVTCHSSHSREHWDPNGLPFSHRPRNREPPRPLQTSQGPQE